MEEGLLTQIPCATKELFSPIDSNYELYLLKHDLKQELEKQLDKYISVLNHDIKTPALAQMRALEYLLADERSTLNTYQKDLITMTLESCQEQYDIINNLINTLKYKKQEIPLNCSSFDIVELFKINLFKMKSIITAKDNSVTFNCKIPELIVCADREKLSEAIFKLIKYAVNRACKDSAINVEIKESNEQSNIIINISEKIPNSSCGFSYSGVYIPQEDYNSVGSNLELGLAEEIVSAHNGKLSIEQSGNKKSIEVILPKKYVQY